MKTATCAHCGQSFPAQLSTARYCSNKCRQAASRARRPRPAPMPYLLLCQICGVEYLATRADSRFCGPSCRTHAHNQRHGMHGPPLPSPLWREGDNLDRVESVKESGKFWDRRSWSAEW